MPHWVNRSRFFCSYCAAKPSFCFDCISSSHIVAGFSFNKYFPNQKKKLTSTIVHGNAQELLSIFLAECGRVTYYLKYAV